MMNDNCSTGDDQIWAEFAAVTENIIVPNEEESCSQTPNRHRLSDLDHVYIIANKIYDWERRSLPGTVRVKKILADFASVIELTAFLSGVGPSVDDEIVRCAHCSMILRHFFYILWLNGENCLFTHHVYCHRCAILAEKKHGVYIKKCELREWRDNLPRYVQLYFEHWIVHVFTSECHHICNRRIRFFKHCVQRMAQRAGLRKHFAFLNCVLIFVNLVGVNMLTIALHVFDDFQSQIETLPSVATYEALSISRDKDLDADILRSLQLEDNGEVCFLRKRMSNSLRNTVGALLRRVDCELNICDDAADKHFMSLSRWFFVHFIVIMTVSYLDFP